MKERPRETREAVIQFELYRFLMNSITSRKQFGAIRYVGVEPEVPARTRSADLVIKAEIDSSPVNILVIEVKKRTDLGLLVFDSDAREQAKRYAEALSAPYYSVTDCQYLRFFKTQNDKYEENYKFSLDKDAAELLLKGLSDLYEGKALGLLFCAVRPPIEEIKELSTGLMRKLLELFQELSGKGTITVTMHDRVEFLNIGHHKGVLRLILSDNSLDVRLMMLRKALGPDRFTKMIKELSEIPGFQWVQDEANTKQNSWRFVKDLITKEPDLKDLLEDLRKWILELDRVLSGS